MYSVSPSSPSEPGGVRVSATAISYLRDSGGSEETAASSVEEERPYDVDVRHSNWLCTHLTWVLSYVCLCPMYSLITVSNCYVPFRVNQMCLSSIMSSLRCLC